MNHEDANNQDLVFCEPARIHEIARQAAVLPWGRTREEVCAAIATAAGCSTEHVLRCLDEAKVPWEIVVAYGFDGHRCTAEEIEDLLRPRTPEDYVIHDITLEDLERFADEEDESE